MANKDKATTAKRAPIGPRPVYIAYDVNEDGSISVINEATTRKAEEMLTYVDNNPGTKWFRTMVK